MQVVLTGPASRRLRWPVLGGMALLLLATLAAAAQTLPRGLLEGREGYCEVVRGSFERTSKLARDLTTTLESLDAEGPEVTAARLAAIREGLEQEARLLASYPPPPGAEAVQVHGTATVRLLIDVANPAVVRTEEDRREEVAAFIREQFLAARTEARAAAAALRQQEPHCPSRRAQTGIWQLLRRR